MEIFKKVSWTFLNFFFAFIFLLVAFTLSFVSLLPQHRAFEDPASFIKVIVMMLGEIEYDDLIQPELKGGNKAELVFPGTAHVLLAIFILLFTVVIMNMLFGLAVADIQELYQVGRLHQLVKQVKMKKGTNIDTNKAK